MTEHHVGTVPADIGDGVEDLAPSGPAVLFVCTHNSGRSQMAVAFFNHLVGDRALGLSGGSQPAAQVDPLVVRVMAERGIDIAGASPQQWTDVLLQSADVVIDMGCEDTDPLMFGHRFEMWPLPDPKGREIEEIRAIRDDIEQRVRRLIVNLGLAVRTRA